MLCKVDIATYMLYVAATPITYHACAIKAWG